MTDHKYPEAIAIGVSQGGMTGGTPTMTDPIQKLIDEAEGTTTMTKYHLIGIDEAAQIDPANLPVPMAGGTPAAFDYTQAELAAFSSGGEWTDAMIAQAQELRRQDEIDKRAAGTPDTFEAGEPATPVAWKEREPNVFVADIGIYEAKVFDPDPGECWRWSLELVGDLDPKVDSASGIFPGDVDGAKARAEEMAAVLSMYMERP